GWPGTGPQGDTAGDRDREQSQEDPGDPPPGAGRRPTSAGRPRVPPLPAPLAPLPPGELGEIPVDLPRPPPPCLVGGEPVEGVVGVHRRTSVPWTCRQAPVRQTRVGDPLLGRRPREEGVRPVGFEPTTLGLEVPCSIH